ncbi:hypothetical protein [Ruegeria arenilitoris]|uniref:hypothetical protein n=1 Tax=Ruegeria arenilitoris TaxID=1173585 RepID=UPI00147B6E3F|nr:hypothetical protein [Ruegeria arenilitoris]
MQETHPETPPLWYKRSPKELIDVMISHTKFEITVAGAPIVVFSFGQAIYADDFSDAGIYWASVFLILSMVLNYLVISTAMQTQRAVMVYDALDDKTDFVDVNVLPLAHPFVGFLAKSASAFLTLGYLILGYALLF